MPANEPTWTEQRVELLKNRFEAGLTAREIAVDIGVSRNAVIGKLSRLNLHREKDIDQRRLAQKQDPKKPIKGRRLKTTPRLQYEMLRSLYAEPGVLDEDAPINSEHRCSLLELSEEKCRWPISAPGADDFCFCGNRPVEGLPYCAGHTRLAYRPGSRQRLARG
jgi:GcrA cell cycle regulator